MIGNVDPYLLMMNASVDPYSLTYVPALAPPPGQQPNFDHPWSIRPAVRLYIPIGIALATLTMMVRVYSKTFILRLWKAEDTLMVIGWVLFIVVGGTTLCLSQYGAGVHQWDISIADFLHAAEWVYIIGPLLIASGLFIKTSICLQLIHIFIKGKGPYYWICWTCTYVQAVQILISLALNIFQCWPINKFWQPWVSGRCIEFKALFPVTALITCITDVIMFSFPLILVVKLQMKWKKKVSALLVFAVASIAIVASVMRLVFAIRVLKSPDRSFYFAQYGACSIAELNTGIIAGNVVCFPSFFKTIEEKFDKLGLYAKTRKIVRKTFKHSKRQCSETSEALEHHDQSNTQLYKFNHMVQPPAPTVDSKLGIAYEVHQVEV